MEDDLAIKKARITKLNSLNYKIQATITKAVIKAKDMQDTIKLSDLEAEMSVKSMDNGIIEGKVAESGGATDTKINCVMDAKARTVIIGYCGPEALSRILYLQTAKKQQEILEHVYFPMDR